MSLAAVKWVSLSRLNEGDYQNETNYLALDSIGTPYLVTMGVIMQISGQAQAELIKWGAIIAAVTVIYKFAKSAAEMLPDIGAGLEGFRTAVEDLDIYQGLSHPLESLAALTLTEAEIQKKYSGTVIPTDNYQNYINQNGGTNL